MRTGVRLFSLIYKLKKIKNMIRTTRRIKTTKRNPQRTGRCVCPFVTESVTKKRTTKNNNLEEKVGSFAVEIKNIHTFNTYLDEAEHLGLTINKKAENNVEVGDFLLVAAATDDEHLHDVTVVDQSKERVLKNNNIVILDDYHDSVEIYDRLEELSQEKGKLKKLIKNKERTYRELKLTDLDIEEKLVGEERPTRNKRTSYTQRRIRRNPYNFCPVVCPGGYVLVDDEIIPDVYSGDKVTIKW